MRKGGCGYDALDEKSSPSRVKTMSMFLRRLRLDGLTRGERNVERIAIS